MNIEIDPTILEAYPELQIGILITRDIDNMRFSEKLRLFVESKLKEILSNLNSDILNSPFATVWDDIYRKMGVNPKKIVPTIKAILRRVLKKGSLPFISPVVTLYLLVEIERLLPIGGYDLRKINNGIILRFSKGEEEFIPLGNIAKEVTLPGEIVYADSRKILTRFWNYKDSEYTKIDETSKDIILMAESPFKKVADETYVEETMKILGDYIVRFCGGEARPWVLSKTFSVVKIYS